MGILSGCDIVFTVKSAKSSDQDVTIQMGSTLSFEQASYEEIAKQLIKNEEKRLALRDALKLKSEHLAVKFSENIVHNDTVKSLASAFTDYDWSKIDQSTKILTADYFLYYGNDLSNTIIIQKDPKTGINSRIYVVDPCNISQVSELHQYLLIQSKLNKFTEDVEEIIKNSDIDIILKQLPTIISLLKKDVDEFNKIENTNDVKQKNSKKFIKLQKSKTIYEHFQDNIPKYSKELLLDYLENRTKYNELFYYIGDSSFSVDTALNDVILLLQEKNVKEANYNDVFVNEITKNSHKTQSPINKNQKVSKIKQSDFIKALRLKASDLSKKRQSLDDKSEKYIESIELEKKINKFVELKEKKLKHWQDIIKLMLIQADDEYSYQLDSIGKGVLYLKNVPTTLEEKYQDFTRKSIELLNPDEKEYYGHTIYVSPKGEYYFSRHVLTTKSYGSRYKSPYECKKAIENKLKWDSIGKQSLIEFKTRETDVVFLPNKFISGQIVKSLNIRFKKSQSLNNFEKDLIYHIDDKQNTLQHFYNYVSELIEETDYAQKKLQEIIDTAEKASCFIYMLNEKFGTERTKITKQDFDSMIDRIKEAKYEYFIIEEVGDGFNLTRGGLHQYTTSYKDKEGRIQIKNKKFYKTLITPILSSEISEQKITYDSKHARPIPSIRLLEDLSKKIYDKLNINIYIKTQSELEELFKKWKEEMPSDVRGFIRNGEIYINGSLATQTDLFHEYTHIMLGVLKAINFDNYYNLVDIVANSDKGKFTKKFLKQSYPNLSESDLNEEVFADLFAKFMQGKDLDSFLNKTLSDARKAVDEGFGNIFSSDIITEEFYNADIYNIFRQFGHDLGLIMNEKTGLELSQGTNFRRASNWIESQIKKYKDSDGKVGIYENCK